ncbi:MAG: DNA polymerase III subunit beta [bacterium]
MLIILEKKGLAEVVHTAARFAQRGSATLPALSSILIVAGDDGIKFRATNLEVGVDLKADGEIKTPGVVALPANLLQQVASALQGNGSVTLERTGDTVVLSSGTSRGVLKTVPYEDFPTIPFPESPKSTFQIPGTLLRTALNSVVSCASTSTIRPELASVLVASEGGSLVTAATDSFRLAEKHTSLPGSVPSFSLLIPAKNALDIVQTLPDEAVTLSIDEHQCAIGWGGSLVTTRLVSGNYPDYRQIIPKTFSAEATVLRRDLDAALKRTTIFSDSFQKVRMAFDKEKKQISLQARNADVGESSETISGSLTGENIELSFNHRYLQAAVALSGAESVTLSAGGVGRPLVIKGVGDASFLYLVMPMNQ